MIGDHLESGTLTELRPLGVDGDPVYRSAPELRKEIERRLGPDFAASLAIPQGDESGSSFDWYAPAPGPVRHWSELSEDEQSRALKQLQRVQQGIAALADEMTRDDVATADQRRARQSFGRLLRHVTTIPDESHLFLVDGRPVIAFWGFCRRAESDPTDALAGSVRIDQIRKRTSGPPRPRTIGERLSGAVDTPHRFWYAALAAAALLVLVWLLWPTEGRRQESPTQAESTMRTDAPGGGLDHNPDQSGSGTPVRQTGETSAPPGVGRIDDQGARGESIIIPAGAIATGSTDFLTGRWRAVGDALIESVSGQPITLTYQMDGGRGEIQITELDGTICLAEVAASFDGSVLALTPLTPIACPRGSGRQAYYGVTITCRPTTDQRSECAGRFPDGKRVRVDLLRQPD